MLGRAEFALFTALYLTGSCFGQTANNSPAPRVQTKPPAQRPASSPQTEAGNSHSSLPDSALQQARQAEQELTANQPEKAITILRKLQKEYPDNSALSLRLAQIYDTMGRNGYALFYYRRYVAQAGPRARDLAIERVSSLELMAGIGDQVKQAEKDLGQTSRPVATPTPIIKRMLATAAKDGSLVPIRNEEDFERIRRQGVPETAETPIPTPSITPIILPSQPTPAPAAASTAAIKTGNRRLEISSPATGVNSSAAPDKSATPQAHNAAPDGTSPGTKPNQGTRADEDALLAHAFSKGSGPETISARQSPAAAPETEVASATASEAVEAAAVEIAPSQSSQPAPLQLPPADAAAPPVSPHLSSPASSPPPRPTPAAVAFLQPTPEYESNQAASFFNVTAYRGDSALVALINEIPSAVLTLSITPPDDSPVISAILTTNEQKRISVRPGTYEVTATIATTDYSPVTLMTRHFKYTFTRGKQYTRRFNKNNIQQLN